MRRKPSLAEDEPTHIGPQSGVDLPRAVRPPALELVHGPGCPRTFALTQERLVVGRSAEADVRISSIGVSRQHAALTLCGDGFTCEDLESRNGVFLNGIKIHSAILRDGDRVELGELVFIYHEGSS